MSEKKVIREENLEAITGGTGTRNDEIIEPKPDPQLPLQPELPEKVCPTCGKKDKILHLVEYYVCCNCMTKFTD